MDVSERLANLLLSRYAIERELGAGGMATVYLARDLRHNRRVALKVLHPELSAILGPERFLKEIEVTANLQHPHILPLFDSGEAEGLLFYVMPYVEGETLRKRLERERQLPVANALRIASEVSDALAYAHRHGLVHRDVKPENILLHEGNALVADFGIALAVQSAGGERMTQTGLSLGTPQYMAPEQAMGEPGVGPRADIYALGAVVYEMLAGEPPFSGPSSAAVLSRVLTERPPKLRAYRPQVPEHVEAALERALEKLPADRWQTASELAEALRGARPVEMHGVEPGQRLPAPAAGSGQERRITRRTLAGWLTAAIVGAVLMGAALMGAAVMRPGESPQGIALFAVTPPAGETVGSLVGWDPDIAVSGDGRRIAFVGVGATGRGQLYVRDIDQLAVMQLAGLSDPRTPFFSPDGNWLGYFDGLLELRKISVTGGPSFLITAGVGNNRGASWGPDDFIIYANQDVSTGLLRISASGGEPEVLTTPDPEEGEAAHILPDILPGGRAVLFTILTAGGVLENARIAVLDLQTGEQKILVQGGTNARYASSGHIVYAAGSTLRAIAFDTGRLETRGSPVTVVDRVVVKRFAAANFALSRTGILAYLPSQAGATARTLVWVDRQGREEPVGAPPRAYTNPRISPDGSRLALDVRDEEQDIWTWDLAQQRLTRLTFGSGDDQYPVWMPDGREIVFSSSSPGSLDLHRRPADGTGTAQLLLEDRANRRGYSVSPDSRQLVFSRESADSGWDLFVLSFDEGLEVPLVQTRFDERNGELSPDGRWLAYQSDLSGRTEVYVRPFPAVDAGRWQVSLEGGSHPLWARDGRELFYLGLDGRLMAVPVQLTNGNFGSGNPSRLLERAYFGLVPGRSFDVSLDGSRFLMIEEAGPEATAGTPPPLLIVLNWFEELKRLVR